MILTTVLLSFTATASAQSQDTPTGVVVHGNVFGAGRGLDNDANAAKVGTNATVTISSGHVIGHVYGGGEMASVGDPNDTKVEVTDETPFGFKTGTVKVTINGTAQVGTDENCIGDHALGGYVYGSGKGLAGSSYTNMTYVKNTIVTIGGTAKVRGSVFGSGENGHVRKDTRVYINDLCEIGTELTDEEHTIDENGRGVLVYRGNVYGGGRGIDHQSGTEHYSLTAGLVGGDTYVEVSGGKIYHDVFGGGSLATVGTATVDESTGEVSYGDKTGNTQVVIKGGVIGYSAENPSKQGFNCGFVYGGCRGLAAAPETDAVKMAYVHHATVTIQGGADIKGSVFGGGANGHVKGDTQVTISGGSIGTALLDNEVGFDSHGVAVKPVFRGNVYAGGRGVDLYQQSGSGDAQSSAAYSLTAGAVYGNATLTMTGGHVWHNIYGSGAMASVGTVQAKPAGAHVHDEIVDENGTIKNPDGDALNYLTGLFTESTGTVRVTITGGTVGDTTPGHEGCNNGRVYGAGRGVSANRSDYVASMEYVKDTYVTIGTEGQQPSGYTGSTAEELNYPYIYGAVFGGGENGHVKHDSHVTIHSGIIGFPLVKGDNSEYMTAADGSSTNPFRGNVFGGGRGVDIVYHGVTEQRSSTAGRVYGHAFVNMTGGLVRRAIYGGGLLASVGIYRLAESDMHIVDMIEDEVDAGDASVTVSGGLIGNVDTDGTPLSGEDYLPPGDNNGHIFGSSCGMVADDYKEGDVAVDVQYKQMGYAHSTYVNISGGHIFGSVFGSGENGHVWEDARINISGGEIGSETSTLVYSGNVYGSGRGADHPHAHISETAGKVRGNTTVSITGGTVWRDVYGGGSLASVGLKEETSDDNKKVSDTDPLKYNPFPYSTGLARVVIDGTTPEGGEPSTTIHGSVYGSGRGKASTSEEYQQAAYVKNTLVTIKGTAQVTGNVYGGGNAGHVRKNTHVTVSDAPVISGSVYGGGAGSTESTTAGVVFHNVEVNIEGGTIKKNVYGGGAVADSNLHDQDNTNTDNDECKEQCTTVVNLTGGLIEGDAYGGGEGIWNTPNSDAKVWGDVHVTLGGTHTPGTATSVASAGATAFKLGTTTDDAGNETAASGRVFGCNNLNGSPQGNVTVDVWKTVAGKDASDNNVVRTPEIDKENDAATHTYEVAAIYGGGNLASYETGVSTAKTNVIIETCDVSVREVYGGGNAAAVPEASVEVKGAYEIETVFGGGNGKDKYTVDNGTSWQVNPGAEVMRDANTVLRGGTIHEAYGGSNAKGTIHGNTSIMVSVGGDCELCLGKMYGAGKEADLEGGSHIIMGCVPAGMKIAEIYGGAERANVLGDVELTITSGEFGKVFGGNKTSGIIKGSITVNIEETGCSPIIIDELYGCGNEAPYSVYGYNSEGTPRTRAQYDALTDEQKTAEGLPYGDPVVNAISFTRIGQVFGGGLGASAVVHGSPTVNVNQIYGKAYEGEEGSQTFTATATTLGPINEVFGGGNEAVVNGDAAVNIATAATVDLKSIKDNAETEDVVENRFTVVGANIDGTEGIVYGGGNNADITGNTTVSMAGGYVMNRIYGGGKMGSVGTYTTTTTIDGHAAHDGCTGKIETFTEGTGTCTVNVSGGRVGPFGMTMPADFGYVFGASRGRVCNPADDPDISFRTYAYDTHVNISGDAFIIGGVYGGSENGRVRHDTHVTISDGHIGVGAGLTEKYTDEQFVNPLTTTVTSGDGGNALAECASWPYGKVVNGKTVYMPYDPETTAGDTTDDADPEGSDGHTFYGNVFGGGSGFFPYEIKDGSGNVTGHEWLETAGEVEGDTYVSITGGHILTSVYGGNELTDVKGTCHVTMNGGTLGVPRTLDQITAHPVTCYLFGAGKGDQRVHFNQRTNVGAVEVTIGGTALIYGSVFGGGEDGHVLGDVSLTVQDSPVIGTWGTSYVDGNIFGAGRGFGGDALTAGVVSGNVTIDIKGGTMLGSVYGGGRLASVGTHLVPSENANYGKLIPDGKKQDIGKATLDDDANATHGYVTINISGGTIGNNREYIYPANESMTGEEWTAWKTSNHIPQTEYGTAGTDKNRLLHTRGGNVFAGAMGRLYALDGSTVLTYWADMGKARKTTVNISGGHIKSNVYGGGELGTLVEGSEITITGGTIGTEVKDESNNVKYLFGSVFGGGYGSAVDGVSGNSIQESKTVTAKDHAGYVLGSTRIVMAASTGDSPTRGTVLGSVYGGGELAWVSGNTNISVSDGEIGKNELNGTDTKFGGYRMGNIFGGGKGSETYVKAGLIKGNTTVNISGGSIYHNIYGGGALGSVGTFELATDDDTDTDKDLFGVAVGTPVKWTDGTGTATVTITGGTIGINGHDNGMVSGSSRGAEGNPNVTGSLLNQLAWVKDAIVTVGTRGTSESPAVFSTPVVKGSVYGGGENGHNFGDGTVYFHSGTIGNAQATGDYDCGNIYGGGCGTDKYDSDNDGTADAHNPFAGQVRGSTTVNVTGGHVIRNVYGGGSMGSLGNSVDAASGKATINITGGRIGTDSIFGSVYGGSKGDLNDADVIASVKATEVNINYVSTPTADNAGHDAQLITGSVFGGGEAGIVENSVEVNMLGGLVLTDVYGGGALAHTNTSNWGTNTWAAGKSSASSTTTVNLKGGIVNGYAYGGGLGRMAKEAVAQVLYTEEDAEVTGGTKDVGDVKTPAQPAVKAIAAKVYGDVLVELNKPATTTTGEGESATTTTTYGDCEVRGNIFGCNNLNGSPQGGVTVHVYKTVARDNSGTVKKDKPAKDTGSYELAAVYGGGNLAAYYPDDATTRATAVANVIIDGCDLTSIQTVYGGGNAASVPETDVVINGTYEVGQAFGGGNGANEYTIDGKTYENPGANVGYMNYVYHTWDDTANKYIAHEYTTADGTDKDASTKDKRVTNYGTGYGTGKAHVTVLGGTVHSVYAGSNTRGNIRVESRATLVDADDNDCEFNVTDAYGGGRNALQDGDAILDIGCITGLGKAYGGASYADVNGNIELNITNGTYGQVFGGNDMGGCVRGSITVNVEETGCNPIIIGELYGGGNEAAYSVYGYNDDGSLKTSGTAVASPTVNVRSFTSIGRIFGGGYGTPARMVGDPVVNVNVLNGKYAATEEVKEGSRVVGSTVKKPGDTGYDASKGFPVPSHAKNAIGAIQDVFGGGNAAEVVGTTHVNIGTEEYVPIVSVATGDNVKGYYTRSGSEGSYTYTEITDENAKAQEGTVYYQKVLGVDIRGNVYGGGNAADVSGDTNVVIGQKK